MDDNAQISHTIHGYVGRRTDSTKSIENFQLGRGVGDNPLAVCRFNLDETRGWTFFDTQSWTSLVPSLDQPPVLQSQVQ